MSQAHEIMMSSPDAASAIERAEQGATDTEQDWDNERTIFTFEDGSVLLVSGPQVNAFHSLEDAIGD